MRWTPALMTQGADAAGERRRVKGDEEHISHAVGPRPREFSRAAKRNPRESKGKPRESRARAEGKQGGTEGKAGPQRGKAWGKQEESRGKARGKQAD